MSFTLLLKTICFKHMVMIFILVRKYLHIKLFRKKPTVTIIPCKLLTVTYYRIYVNYKILGNKNYGKKLAIFKQFYGKKSKYQFFMHFFLLTSNETGRFIPKWDWYDCSQVTLSQIFRSKPSTIVCTWDWHNCSQVTLARLFPSETCTSVSKWDWHGYSQRRLAWVFLIDTDMIVFKWHWHDFSQVRQAQLWPADTSKIASKWHWHICS